MKFNKITKESLNEIVIEAGLILKTFNVSAPNVKDEDIVCTTTGGVTITCNPTFEDWGSDIDNCPDNTIEMKRVTGYECSIAFTSIDCSETSLKLALGAADIDPETHKVTPRRELKASDFSDVWFAGDKVGGGMFATVLKNALGTGGFSLKTTKKGKGQVSVTLSGHVSIENPDEVPMEFWSTDGDDASTYGYDEP